MRILLVSSSSGSRGGGEIYLRYMAHGLIAQGHDVALWTSTDSIMDELHASLPDTCESLRSPYRNTYAYRTRCWGAWRARKKVARSVRNTWQSFRPDVILLNKQNLEDGLDLLHAANSLQIPACATVHITQTATELGSIAAPARDRLCRRILPQFSGDFIAISEGRTDTLRHFASPRTVHTVLNGIPAPAPVAPPQRAAVRTTLGIAENTPYFLCVARLEPQKAPWQFLEQAEHLLSQNPSWHAVWLGGGSWQAEWDKQVALSPVANRIHHNPWVTNPAPWFAEASLYYHPAAFEGLPLSVLEALAHGLPTILTPSVRSEAQALEQSSGVFTDDDAASWWTDLDTADKRAIAGEAARNTFAAHFTLAAMTAATLKVLHDACT